MKQSAYILFIVLIVLSGCKKNEDTRTSGTDTIDNVRYRSSTFYTYGFTFSTGKLVSTETTPKPDLTVDTTTSRRPNVYLQGSINSAFHRYGSYPDEPSAIAAFDALKTYSQSTWEEWANPILPNEIWIFRSGDEKYTKIRIVSITQRNDAGIPVAEVTFQWVHQPDGSLIFP